MRLAGKLAVCTWIASIALGAGPSAGQPCSPGSVSPDGLEPCMPCSAGTYAPLQGATACLACPIGTAANFEGAASCVACDPGSYAAQPGSATCTPCEAGHVVDYAGADACQACPPGYFADQPGQTSCLLCSAGTFASGFGSSGCEPCPAGRYSEVLGAGECTACAPGTASSAVGASSAQSCTPCAVGRYAASPGSASCSACPRNSYAPSTGLAACLACGCDDGLSCTRDTCDTSSGACAAPPVAGCQLVEVAIAGTVTSVDEPLDLTTPIGSPVEGRITYDPEAPDGTPLSATYGDYPSAITSLELAIGIGSPISATSAAGWVSIENGGPNGDAITFRASDSDGLAGPAPGSLPDGTLDQFSLRLGDPAGTALASDALPATAPRFTRFPSRVASLAISSPAQGTVYVDSADVVQTPEAGGALAGAAAIGALLAAARRRWSASR